MRICDWNRVPVSTWHSFHICWIAALHSALNNGGLPTGYYSQVEAVEEGFAKPQRLVIRHESDDRAVAVIGFATPSGHPHVALHSGCYRL